MREIFDMEIALLILAVINVTGAFMIDGWPLRINAICGWLIIVLIVVALMTGDLVDMNSSKF